MKKTMLKLSGLAVAGLLMVGCGNTQSVDSERLAKVEETANNAQARAEAAYEKANEAAAAAQAAQEAADRAEEGSSRKLKRATQK